MAHLNVCSIRNKVHELNYPTTENTFHILAVSETHLDSTVLDTEVSTDGYNPVCLEGTGINMEVA